MRTISIKVGAGLTEEIAVKGNYLRIRSAPYDLIIENPDTSEKVEGSQGDDFELSEFRRLKVTNTGAVDSNFKLTISQDKKAGSAPGVISGTVAPQAGTLVQSQASVTNANQVLIAANSSRKYLLIQNNDSAAVLRVKLDGLAATATAGFRVLPGGVLELVNYQGSAAINCRMEAATAAVNNIEFLEG